MSGEEAANKKLGRGKASARLGRSWTLGLVPGEAAAGLRAEGVLCSVPCFCRSVWAMLQGRLKGAMCSGELRGATVSIGRRDSWSGGDENVWCSSLVVR